jgi:hypothetical protein
MSWWRLTDHTRLVRGTAVAALALLSMQSAHAASTGCDAFKWPLDKERAAFADAGLESVASGAARGAFKEQAFILKLVPEATVVYALPPGSKPKEQGAESFGAIVAFDPPGVAGTFQVTLAGEGWIDVVQNGKHVESIDHTGAKECLGLRKSVRFSVGTAPTMLQLSGVPADTLKVAIRLAE